MAYIPSRCELFKPTAILGWICCECGHFAAYKRRKCRHCGHKRCEKPLPEKPREAPQRKPGRPPKKARQEIEKP